MNEHLPIIFFCSVFASLLLGYPVAFTIGGVSVLFGIFIFDIDFFYLLSLRIYGTMQNFVLLAVPLFVFMGITLQRSGIAEDLLETMSVLMSRVKGGLALSVVIVGGMLAASTGVVGATVVTMGLISLPTLLKKGYHPHLATGTIVSSGTLGQIIPPSVVLVLLGTVLNVSVGHLFMAALLPGLLLVGCYLLYILMVAHLRPNWVPQNVNKNTVALNPRVTLVTFLLPFSLIASVLGSIFAGVASPTEAAGIGAVGAIILTFFRRRLTLQTLKEVMEETASITSMVFMILIGATAFSLVFRGIEGDDFLINMIRSSSLEPALLIALIMLIVFLTGFFIDFIEIIFIIVPVITPIFLDLKIDLIWVGILLAMNLQTSFLTPPFGFSLFYLKGVAPPEIKTSQIYAGAIPFIIIQILILLLITVFPDVIDFLPKLIFED